MVESILFLATLFCVVYLITWYLKNKDARNEAEMSGFIVMKDEE